MPFWADIELRFHPTDSALTGWSIPKCRNRLRAGISLRQTQ